MTVTPVPVESDFQRLVWEVANANLMAELCCLTYSDQWADYWMVP